MKNRNFFIVDVFAEEKYTGNPLAVVLNAENLSHRTMQQIAKEMNYSETTFILSKEPINNGYDVKIFTPEEEVPFAGYPTLGSAFIIQQKIIGKNVSQINLNLGIGQIPVIFEENNERLWMKQKPPVFGEIIPPAEMTPILNLSVNDIDERFPIQAVSTGFPFFIVPIKTLKAVKHAWIATNKYFEFVAHRETKDILIFCPETYHKGNNLNVRVFPVYHGIPEDPATGSANGCLAGYLIKHRYFDQPHIDIRVEQGYEIGRPSLLYCRAEETNDKIHVSV